MPTVFNTVPLVFFTCTVSGFMPSLYTLKKRGKVFELRFAGGTGDLLPSDITLTVLGEGKTIAAFRTIGRSLSTYAFDGEPVEIHLCNDKLNMMEVIIP